MNQQGRPGPGGGAASAARACSKTASPDFQTRRQHLITAQASESGGKHARMLGSKAQPMSYLVHLPGAWLLLVLRRCSSGTPFLPSGSSKVCLYDLSSGATHTEHCFLRCYYYCFTLTR